MAGAEGPDRALPGWVDGGTLGVRNQMGERAVAAFYELRQYKIQPGKMAEWLECMEKEIIPFQVGKGMVITGSFRGETDESVYVWIRRFESEEQRVQLYKDVYESDFWKNDTA